MFQPKEPKLQPIEDCESKTGGPAAEREPDPREHDRRGELPGPATHLVRQNGDRSPFALVNSGPNRRRREGLATRRFGRLGALRAHTNAPYKTATLWETLWALSQPGRARTAKVSVVSASFCPSQYLGDRRPLLVHHREHSRDHRVGQPCAGFVHALSPVVHEGGKALSALRIGCSRVRKRFLGGGGM